MHEITLEIFAKPNAQQESISWDPDTQHYVVAVNSPATKGKANKAIIKALKSFFKARKVVLVGGTSASTKIVRIVDPQNLPNGFE